MPISPKLMEPLQIACGIGTSFRGRFLRGRFLQRSLSPSARIPFADALRACLDRRVLQRENDAMRLDRYSFGTIRIDGVTYDHDVVIDASSITKRGKKPPKPLRDAFGHTPLSTEEEIPWNCARLVIGSGASGSLPVMDEVR